jgi:hypothetical protein
MSEDSTKKEKIAALTKDIWKSFSRGGSHGHNIVQYSLKELSVLDREAADSLYTQLVEEGY